MAAAQPMAPSFDVQLVQVGREFLLRVQGPVDFSEVTELQRQFQKMHGPRTKLAVLDLSQLAFISQPGLAAIVQFARKVARGCGEVILAAVPHELRGAFLTDDLEGLVTLSETVEEALNGSWLGLMLD
ncbi:MAG: STAS domain-containing protein [Planctomycetia bacterium]|nr:STAS domain-containing protein [Planctomycetia bacterium]